MPSSLMHSSILKLAFTGHLVSHVDDDSAADILNQINLDWEKHPSAERKKKLEYLECITPDDIPNNAPSSWEWVRLGKVCRIVNGKKESGRELPYLEAKVLRGQASPNMKKTGYFVSKGTNIILVDGENSGEIFSTPCDGYLGSTFRILVVSDALYLPYLLKFIENNKSLLKVSKKGAAIPHLNPKIFFNLLLPIPPIVEQRKIIDILTALTPLIEAYEKEEHELSMLDGEFLNKIRMSVLHKAMSGRLVPQIASEGTADELLKQIDAERVTIAKAKKVKKNNILSVITEDEIPFEIPKSWKWVRFGTLCHLIHYGYTASASKEGNAKLLRITDIQDDMVDWNKLPYCTISTKELEKYNLNKGDILFARTGGTVGKTYLVKTLDGEIPIVFASYLIRAIPMKAICDEYIKKFMESPLYWSQVFNKAKGTGQDNVNGEELKQLLFPLPPLSEQKRIVAKLECLMESLNKYHL